MRPTPDRNGAGPPARSWLYVPADKPRMLAGALDRGADALIVDLEDAVLPSNRSSARRQLASWLDGLPASRSVPIWVRINAAGPDGQPPVDDLAAAVHPNVWGVVQAKAQDRSSLERLDAALVVREQAAGLEAGTLGVAALVETADGVLALRDLAASPRVTRLQLGEADLVASIGMSPSDSGTELLPIRLATVVVSATMGLPPPVGSTSRKLDDEEGLRRSSEALRRLGFGGRSAIHPAQISIINEAFTPSEEEVVLAREILTAAANAVQLGAAVAVGNDGRMIDEAVVKGARMVVGLADAIRGRNRPVSAAESSTTRGPHR
jgi:citrate lyase subunit beta/citryl-CoA lyase